MADTALTIITDALLDLGVLADEETPTASQAAGALRKLNNMIDTWNINSLMVYGAKQYILPLVSNQGVYTIGPNGNLNIPRPNYIASAYIRDTSQPATNQYDIPIQLFDDAEWADLPFKGMTGPYPIFGAWFDDGYPLINVYLSPIPTTTQYSLVFWAEGLISNLLLNDAINLSPGYKRALTSNLCIELAPSYGVEPSQTIATIAMSSMADIKVKNFQLNELSLGGGSHYDIRSNGYR